MLPDPIPEHQIGQSFAEQRERRSYPNTHLYAGICRG